MNAHAVLLFPLIKMDVKTGPRLLETGHESALPNGSGFLASPCCSVPQRIYAVAQPFAKQNVSIPSATVRDKTG